jgi:hypothetical protein
MIKILLTTAMFILLVAFVHPTYGKDHSSEMHYRNVKISPDGKYLAISLTLEGMSSLVFRDRKTNKILGFTKLPEQLVLGDYQWVNNERVVFKIYNKVTWSDKPQFYGELFAINFDGSKVELIYGYSNGEKQIGSRAKKKKSIFGWGDIINILPDDKKHILISSTPMNSTKDNPATVYKLNVYTGLIDNRLAKSPLSFSTFITNSTGDLVGVVGKTINNQQKLLLRKNEQWESVNEAMIGENFKVILPHYSDGYLYLFDDIKGHRGLFRLNIAENLYESVDFDMNVNDFEKYSIEQSTKGLPLSLELTEFLLLNKQTEDAQTYERVISTFPNKKVTINSKTTESDLFIVAVFKNDSSGDLYLFNKEKNHMKYLNNFEKDPIEVEFLHIDNNKQVSFNDNTIRLYPSGFKG